MATGAVAHAFKKLHADGLIYRGSYMVNWAPTLQTAVSDLEVEYSDESGTLFYFKYVRADDPSLFLPIATTRPETILGDAAVAVHPDDPRFAEFVGKEVVVPMSGGRKIPVISDDYVDMDFGTGVLKITPAHDVNDYAIGMRRQLEFINIMNRDATMNDAAGRYNGLDRFECRKQLWDDMRADGLVIKTEPYTNRCAAAAAAVVIVPDCDLLDYTPRIRAARWRACSSSTT
jgi:valyl-tRNA synthetase